MSAFLSEFTNSGVKFREQTEHRVAKIAKRKTNTNRHEKSNQFKLCKNAYSQQYKLLLDVLESISDNVLALDSNWNVIYANKRQANVFGYTPSEMIGKNIWQLLPDLIGTEVEKNFFEVMKNRESKSYEIKGIYRSGFYEQSIFPLQNGITVYTKDVTERKKTEIELIQKTVAIEQAQNAIFITDSTFKLLTWNKGAEELYGYKAQEVLGRATNFLQTCYIGQTEEEVIRQIVERGGWNGEGLQKRRDGSEIYTLISVTQIRDGSSVLGYTAVMRDITQIKLAEEELKKSKQRINDIIESISDDVFSLDKDWNFIYVNKYAANRWGYEPAQLSGKNIWTALPKFVGTALEKNFRESMQDRGVRRFEWKTLYASGIRDVTVFPSAEGVTVYAKDITERKKAEEALRQSEERFARSFHSSPAALFISRLADGFLVDVNESFLKILGYHYEEVVGHTALELNIYPDPSKRAELADILKMRHMIRNFEITVQTKTGKHVTVMASVDVICLNEQDYVLGTFIDITERKKAEGALKHSEERLKLAQRIAHVGSWEFYIKENKAIWSEELFRIFNLKPQEFGPNIEEYTKLIYPDDIETMRNIMENLISKGHAGEVVSFDYRIITSDGTVRVLHTQRIIEEIDETGKPTKIIGIEQDITERKQIEQQLEQYSMHLEKLVEERTKQLKDAERLSTIGQVAGMVGHDIRNPLQAITSELYFAKQSILEAPQTEFKQSAMESLGIIQEQVDYISKIVSDLQDYARSLKPDIKEVDLSELIASTFLAIKVPDRITLSVDIEGFPKLKTDPTFIRRAITNLANNAIQAMPEDGKLTIAVSQKEKQIVITVEDTGKGIPNEDRQKLFTPLFTTKSKGQGFGLAVTKRLIEALGGTIDFESEVCKGTKFKIHLPI